MAPPIPPRLRELAAAAARHSPGRPLDTLDALLLSDQIAARSLFVELYDAADQVHDLSGCQVLLDVLQSRYRLPLLDQDLLDLRHDLSAYLGARNLWSTDYYQSAPYVSRPALEQALEDLLRGRGGRILQLHAADGMGKSMQLRWFIARRCVPAPHRIPCVRIDLDVVASAAATWHPWLLLVEMAAQLDPQLPYGPFQDLLVSYSPYRMLLSPAATAPGSLEIPVSAVEVDGADIRARFTDILVERIGERPVVMAFDSMEHLLRPGRRAYRGTGAGRPAAPGRRLVASHPGQPRRSAGAPARPVRALARPPECRGRPARRRGTAPVPQPDPAFARPGAGGRHHTAQRRDAVSAESARRPRREAAGHRSRTRSGSWKAATWPSGCSKAWLTRGCGGCSVSAWFPAASPSSSSPRCWRRS